MKFRDEIILPSFIVFVFANISKQMKPEDCIPARQYWSTHFINENGTCAACPPLLETCSKQGVDRKSCEDSCFAKPTMPPLKPAAPHKPKFPYRPPVFSSVPPYTSTSGQAKKYSKSTHFNANMHLLLIVLGVLLSILVILGVVAVVVLLCIRKLEKGNETYRDEENGMALEPLHQNNGGDQNDGEGRAQVRNDGEGRAQLPNDGEGRAQVRDNVEGRAQVPDDGEGRMQVPDDGEGHWRVQDDGEGKAQERKAHVPNDGEECVDVPNDFKRYTQVVNGGEEQAYVPNDGVGLANVPNNDGERRAHMPNEFEAPVQESQLPSTTQPTPATSKLIKGMQQEELGSSLNVHTEVHN